MGSKTLRILAHLWVASPFLALAFDPLGIVYEVASPHLARRAGSLGGTAPTITETADSERPYAVDGNTFTDYDSAAQRSCNIQYDSCQLAANTDSSVSFSLEDCQNQQNDCIDNPPAVGNGDTTMSVALDETSDNTESDSFKSDTDPTGSDTGDSDAIESDTSNPDTINSNTAEAELEVDQSGETEPDSETPDTTQPEPVLVSQTTIPYDVEFDLLCDL